MKSDQKELLERIEAHSLDDARAVFRFSERLARENHWTARYVERVICEYKRFTFLAVVADHPVSPSDPVDQAWHLHLIYTEAYWKDFCGNVLRVPLHHHPSRGGAREPSKFDGWYERTLTSYRRIFREEPPADIWPAPENHSGKSRRFARIDTARHWVIRKPECCMLRSIVNRMTKRQWAFGAALLALTLSLAGCGTAMVAMISPLDLRGPEFLWFFAIIWLAVIGIAALIRWKLREPGFAAGLEIPHLDAYEIAYLSGKESLAANAAIARLVQSGAINLHPTDRKVLPGGALPDGSHKLEEAIHSYVALEGGVILNDVRKYTKLPLESVATRLEQLGLLISSPRATRAIVIPLVVTLTVSAFGLIKIYIGLMREKPVTFLALLCIISAVVAVAGFARRPHRSRRGDHVIARLKKQNAPLQHAPLQSLTGATGSAALPLAVGLFGLGILADNGFAELHKRLRPPPGATGCGNADGCEGGSGGSCGGGGCGGGGCGGCGGCGGGGLTTGGRF